MKNFILAFAATLLVMLLSPPQNKQVNEIGNHPTYIKQYPLLKPLEAKAYAQKVELVKVSTQAPKTAPVASGGSCEAWMAQAGIPVTNATKTLIINESGCRHTAINPTSGACGIPQALPCSKMPCTLQDPVCQLRWMDNYIKGRYTTWEKALTFWKCTGRCSNNFGTVTKTTTWY